MLTRGASLDFGLVRPGDRLPELVVEMDRETYFRYNRLAREINPLHFDKDFAARLGFRDIVVAGVYSFGFIPRVVEDWAGASARVRGVEVRFVSPIYLGETVVHKAVVKSKDEADGLKRADIAVAVEDRAGSILTEAVVTLEFF